MTRASAGDPFPSRSGVDRRSLTKIALSRSAQSPHDASPQRAIMPRRARTAALVVLLNFAASTSVVLGQETLEQKLTGAETQEGADITGALTDGLIVTEDAFDRFVAVWIEERVRNPLLSLTVRLRAEPGRTLSNASIGHAPWHRAGRPLSWR